MTRVQAIIKEINQLELADLEIIMDKIKTRIDKRRLLETVFADFIGTAKGFWKTDAQQYVDQLREEEE